jgi:hypothetical protein
VVRSLGDCGEGGPTGRKAPLHVQESREVEGEVSRWSGLWRWGAVEFFKEKKDW